MTLYLLVFNQMANAGQILSSPSRAAINGKNVQFVIVCPFDAFAGSQASAACLYSVLCDADTRSDPIMSVGFGGNGFLSRINKAQIFARTSSSLLRKIAYPFWLVVAQFQMFFHIAAGRHIWLNTIHALPLGLVPALFAPTRIFVHIHEGLVPGFMLVLARLLQRLGVSIICVSAAQMKKLRLYSSFILQNMVRVAPDPISLDIANRVLFVGEPTQAKGFDLFVSVANASEGLPVEFHAFLNKEVNKDFLEGIIMPSNLCLHHNVTDPREIFKNGLLYLQLSDTSLIFETFSISSAEAICFGIPVVTGGAEAVSEVCGPCLVGSIPSRDPHEFAKLISGYVRSPESAIAYQQLCRERARLFGAALFRQRLSKIVFCSTGLMLF